MIKAATISQVIVPNALKRTVTVYSIRRQFYSRVHSLLSIAYSSHLCKLPPAPSGPWPEEPLSYFHSYQVETDVVQVPSSATFSGSKMIPFPLKNQTPLLFS